ncbi:MAG: peptidyl-tRNA hydrolase [Gammaproteobacteria bacterium]|nr:peptidyl-tRNA hydrolase [Gammaproteobacteria bacterium]
MVQTQSEQASPVLLFVGLGNPGSQYAKTRHNAGQWFIHALAKKAGASFSYDSKVKGDIATLRIGATTCRLLIPDDYMNCCGAIIKKTAAFYRIAPEAICVVHDELDLPAGTIRLKYSGGHGGHNGLRDMIDQLQTANFQRLRIGIGHPGQKQYIADFVLKPPAFEERIQIDNSISQALTIVDELIAGNLEKAMRLLHTSTE